MCNKVVPEIKPRPILVKGKRGTPRVELDILAVFTVYTKLLIKKISNQLHWAKSTSCYRLLTRTTQPAHLAVILAVLALGVAVYPTRDTRQAPNTSYQFLYLTTTAIHFGSQIWMTFISGLSLYFSLPRHDFGEVQKVLFPIYFTWSAGLSLVSVFAQVRVSGMTGVSILLAARFILEVSVRARCCDTLVQLITMKNAIEADHGLGREVGKLAANSTLFGSDNYLSLHHKFRRLHMIIAIANMISIGISTIHLWLSLQNSIC